MIQVTKYGSATLQGQASSLVAEFACIAENLVKIFLERASIIGIDVSRAEVVDSVIRAALVGVLYAERDDFNGDITTDELINEYHKLMKEDTP